MKCHPTGITGMERSLDRVWLKIGWWQASGWMAYTELDTDPVDQIYLTAPAFGYTGQGG